MHTAKRSATQRDSSRHYGDERQGSVLCERSCRVLRAGRGHWHAAVSAPTCACGTARRRRGGTVSPKCCPTGQDADRLDSQGDALVRGGSSHVSRNGASRPALCVVGGRVGHRSEAGEALGLRWVDVDLVNGRVVVTKALSRVGKILALRDCEDTLVRGLRTVAGGARGDLAAASAWSVGRHTGRRGQHTWSGVHDEERVASRAEERQPSVRHIVSTSWRTKHPAPRPSTFVRDVVIHDGRRGGDSAARSSSRLDFSDDRDVRGRHRTGSAFSRREHGFAAQPRKMTADARGHRREDCRQSTDNGTSTTMKSTSKLGAPEGIRTPNLLIRSQMLYPLSYGRMCSVVGGGERI